MSNQGAELARRLREGDLSAAPAVLNLVENRTPAAREAVGELLRGVSPAALGGEARGHVVGVTGPPGAGKSTLLSELVGVGQSETEVAEVADTVVVIVQPGSGDVLQFLKSGIMEVPDVLVVTKADLGQVALSARRDLVAALRALGRRDTAVVAVSSIPPVQGIDELVEALDAHRAGLDLAARRLAARRAGALADFAAEHGDRGLRALGGRRAAERVLAEQDPGADVASLVEALEARAAEAAS